MSQTRELWTRNRKYRLEEMGKSGLSIATSVWIAESLKQKHLVVEMIPLRQSLFAKYRHTQPECDALAFRKVRNKCRSEIRKYKAQSQLRTLQISRDNPKYLYKYMRRQRQSSPSPLALKLSDGSAADSLTQVVETFREYF